LLIDVVGIASFFGAALAIVNGGARILFAASREGALPRWLAWTHPTRGTPVAGVAMLCSIGLVTGLTLGLFLSPFDAFAFLGTIDAILVLLIYVLVNIACILFFARKRRAQFSLLRHGIIPALGLLITAGIVAAAMASPSTGALSYIPIIVAVWLALGLILLLVTRGKLAR
jgi:amino acid transporter